MVKFDIKEDREKVINGGPWMIFYHYLAVSTWSPEFISPAAKVTKTLAWVRIPCLNVLFYDESYLLSVARAIGNPIKVDRNTLKKDRRRFARICVELDLTQAIVVKICIENFWYKIEYEGLHMICMKCGCYGHMSRECTATMPVEVTEKTPPQPQEGNPPNPSHETAPPSNGGGSPIASEKETSNSMDISVTADEIAGELNEKESQNVAGAKKVVVNLEDNFEIVGEWMTVVKKKKKSPPKSQGKKKDENLLHNKGTNNGKSMLSDGLWKPRESSSRSANHTRQAMVFSAVKPSHVGPQTTVTSNKRSRVEDGSHGSHQKEVGDPHQPGKNQDQSLAIVSGTLEQNKDSSQLQDMGHESLRRMGASACMQAQVEHAQHSHET
ncbi:uncharacterized protein LOC130719278 [Lotus japonicus]|uniref:uncharacterized protein LOC130719278 n=1 Tax=Lotus japonicus TaxID=34305 RepID=UPI00258CB953|nr:uncharacterized protein LOC130719278 [Lotus japonicus]